ncbi:MAG: hypothetical protein LAT64_12970 [Phycisphaerales bacterium]|nr:hypothetical protein [Planctomycetota bacterium]MCH8509667.1 hypothetical protein [Phycisphaerales bacterium]
MTSPSRTIPQCPRCGYDQSGAVATWTDHCPVEGTCPECGTDYQWSLVFNPSRADIRWLAEQATTSRAMIHRTVPTLLRMVLPWVFWSRVGVLTRTDPARLVMWVIWLMIGMHIAVWPPCSIVYAAVHAGYETTMTGLADYARDADGIQLFWAFVNGLTWPIVTAIDGHLAWGDAEHSGSELWRATRWLLGIGLAWFCVLSLLPVTRRMARLRRAHLVRALLLNAAAVVLVFQLGRVLFPMNLYGGQVWQELALVGLLTGAWFWSLVWWGAALRAGWKVRSWTLLVLGTVAGILGGAVLMTIEDSVVILLRGY